MPPPGLCAESLRPAGMPISTGHMRYPGEFVMGSVGAAVPLVPHHCPGAAPGEGDGWLVQLCTGMPDPYW